MTEDVRDFISEHAPEGLVAEGLDEAIIGVVTVFNKTVVLYDREKCIEALARVDDGAGDRDDALLAAEEYFSFNVEGAWVGDGTPAFATLIKREATTKRTEP